MSDIIKANISDLTPDPRNANKGTQRGRGMLDKSLRQYGAGRSILLDKHNRIIAGNKTTEAAADIGMNDVVIVESDGTKLIAVKRTDLDLDDSAARELAYADNRVAQVDLDWDATQMLQDAVAGIDLDKFFLKDELDEMLGRAVAGDADAEPQIDWAAELNEKWQVKTGDLWRIGAHRLLCGDSEQGVELIKGDYKINAVITDPPYGINIVKGISAAIGGPKPFGRVRPPGCRTPTGKVGGPGVVEPRLYRPVANDDKPFDPAWLLNLSKVIILFGANHFASRLPDSPAWIVWEKNVSDQSTFSACELAWCNVGNHVRRYEWTWSGMVRAGDREVEMKDRIHPTQKPVGMIENIIQDYTEEYEVIIDPYLGSGTTMLAAARTNRTCVGGELDEAYCAVILERMSTAFPSIEIERLVP